MGLTNRILAACLLCSSVAMAAPNEPQEHVVQPGQTLAKIAKRYRVDVDDLCAANDLKKSEKLQLGQRLAIPTDEDPGFSSTRGRDPRSGASKRQPGKSASYSQYLARPTRRGWVRVMGHHGEWQGQLLSKNGKLMPKAATALSRLLAWPRTDFVMDRRLLTLLARVSEAFGGRVVRVVSGYRTTSFVSESKHPLGRACDFHVLGVPNAAVRDYVRTFDNVGVGYYPNSTFVHLDVRDHDAYWVDYAGPGEPPRMQRNRVARRTDSASTARVEAETPVDPEAEADAEARHDDARNSGPSATVSETERGPATPTSARAIGAAARTDSERLANTPPSSASNNSIPPVEHTESATHVAN